MTTPSITTTPDVLLSVLERDARLLYAHLCNPPQNLIPEDLTRHIARMYGCAEQLVEIAKQIEEARKGAANGNGEAEAKAS